MIQIQEYVVLLRSQDSLEKLCKIIFNKAEKKVLREPELLNGLSYITDELCIAKFILENGLPKDFLSKLASKDLDENEEKIPTSTYISKQLFDYYEEVHKK